MHPHKPDHKKLSDLMSLFICRETPTNLSGYLTRHLALDTAVEKAYCQTCHGDERASIHFSPLLLLSTPNFLEANRKYRVALMQVVAWWSLRTKGWDITSDNLPARSTSSPSISTIGVLLRLCSRDGTT
jgi:hypothetical protein